MVMVRVAARRNEYDRMVGISSAQHPERDRFGDGNVTDTEEIEQGVANDSAASHPISFLVWEIVLALT